MVPSVAAGQGELDLDAAVAGGLLPIAEAGLAASRLDCPWSRAYPWRAPGGAKMGM